jgi:AraC family transcriptional regulator of adaptative response/methylated-DNA-[protein]-cysteine methyltransferase|tara:strand:- start:279 stop:1142 length:864 start_codon:yes stop_codon:yes gene_type:complete
MKSDIKNKVNDDFQRIAAAIHYLVDRQEDQPELEDVAAVVGLSPHHFQRVFTRWAGLSPKKFLKHITLDAAKNRLDASLSVMDAAFDVGLSGASRLHDLFVTVDAVTPGEYKSQGNGMVFKYGFHPSLFGEVIVVVSERGLAGLGFTTEIGRTQALAEQNNGWDRATWKHDQKVTNSYAEQVFSGAPNPTVPLSVLMRGTPFQIKVWEALLRIPSGKVISYGVLANRLGQPTAARAVGTACGANRVGFLIPCHRVIRETGAITGYRWGADRKHAMLAWEAAKAEETA